MGKRVRARPERRQVRRPVERRLVDVAADSSPAARRLAGARGRSPPSETTIAYGRINTTRPPNTAQLLAVLLPVLRLRCATWRASMLYLDFISPYAYLACAKSCPREERDDEVVLEPVLFARSWTIRAARPARSRPAAVACSRHAAPRPAIGGAFTFPATHPFRPVTALRLSLPEVPARSRARWSRRFGAMVGSAAVSSATTRPGLAEALREAGLDGARLLARTRETRRERATARAHRSSHRARRLRRSDRGRRRRALLGQRSRGGRLRPPRRQDPGRLGTHSRLLERRTSATR